MMLPEKKREVKSRNPKRTVLYGLPKVGKTGALVELDDCLIIDLEEGTYAHEALAVNANNMDELKAIGGALVAHKNEHGANKYRRIAIDTADKLEEWCEVEAVKTYRNSPIGKSFQGNNILDLPNGAGYGHHREEVKKWLNAFQAVCDELIIVTHVKDKLLASKGGNEVSTKDINLVGKLATIVCSSADAIGYMYRESDKLMISFAGGDNVNAGARPEHLRGQVFEMDWKKIYID